ncbi:hypothetical protein Lser_V15G12309 [Lactuca serriola]
MAGFHIPGDPYYPNQGNGGWIEKDTEEFEVEVGEEYEVDEEVEEEEEPIEEEEEVTDGTDSEPEVINPPAPRSPEVRMGYQPPIPIWGSHLYYWSRQQGVLPPFGMCREFYNVSGGGSADRALPVLVRQIATQTYQSDMQAARIREVNAATQGNAADIRRLDGLHESTQLHTRTLQNQMVTALAEIREMKEQQTVLERRLMGVMQSDAESSSKCTTRRRYNLLNSNNFDIE